MAARSRSAIRLAAAVRVLRRRFCTSLTNVTGVTVLRRCASAWDRVSRRFSSAFSRLHHIGRKSARTVVLNVHYRVLLALVLSVSLLSGCGGGGGGSSTPGGGGGNGNGGGGGGNTLSASGGSITLPISNGITPTFTYPSSN